MAYSLWPGSALLLLLVILARGFARRYQSFGQSGLTEHGRHSDKGKDRMHHMQVRAPSTAQWTSTFQSESQRLTTPLS